MYDKFKDLKRQRLRRYIMQQERTVQEENSFRGIRNNIPRRIGGKKTNSTKEREKNPRHAKNKEKKITTQVIFH